MTSLHFLLDIYVITFESPKLKNDDVNYLSFEATLNSNKIVITKSRINVNDYNPNASFEFYSTAKKLRNNIEDNGLKIKALLKGRAMGDGQVMLPDEFINGIQEDMKDLEQQEQCSILWKGEEVGKVTFKLRLVIKCDKNEQEEKICRPNMPINPADIMFVMADPVRCPKFCDNCEDAMKPEEGDERLQLDLDRYKPVSNKRQPNELPKEKDDIEASRELKKMSKEYESVFDSLLAQTYKLNTPLPDDKFQATDWSGKATNILATRNEERTIPVPVEDWQDNGINPTRFCPVCLTPMSWLPKYASCPKCCTKPKPVMKKNAADQMTADQVMDEFLKLPPKTGEKEDESGRCDCSCKANKMCLHCRMQMMSADVFKKEPEKCPNVEPTLNQDFHIVVEKKTNCRPHLDSVFEELVDLYHKKEAKGATQLKLDASGSRSSKGS
ncbi:hypothetical protein KR044_003852, partial [Drosophila immigrans]